MPPGRKPPPDASVPPLDGMVTAILKGGDELLKRDDPLEAELWASQMLSVTYKRPGPPEATQALEAMLRPALVEESVSRADTASMVVLRSIAAIAEGPLAAEAGRAASRLAEQGVEAPQWVSQLGNAKFVDAFQTEEPAGDQVGYYATFRHAGGADHMIVALYDASLGGIVKDAFAGYLRTDMRSKVEAQNNDVNVTTSDPAEMAKRILAGIETGDQSAGQPWSDDFKQTRALLINRMSKLAP